MSNGGARRRGRDADKRLRNNRLDESERRCDAVCDVSCDGRKGDSSLRANG